MKSTQPSAIINNMELETCPYCDKSLSINERGDLEVCEHVVFVQGYDPDGQSFYHNSLSENATDWLNDLAHDFGHPPASAHQVVPLFEEGYEGSAIFALSVLDFAKAANEVWEKGLKKPGTSQS